MTQSRRISTTTATVPNVRASAISARLGWVRKHHGGEAVNAVLAALPQRQASAVAAAVSPSLWVPFDAFIALSETIDRMFGSGDLALCRVLGRHAADVNLPTLYRIFYKVGNVRYIMSKATAVWSAHYDSGSASIRDTPDGGFMFSVERFAMPHKAHCLSVLGWIEQTVHITGARLISSRESQCRTTGGSACEFHIIYR